MAQLIIAVEPNDVGLELACFPLLDGQYIDGESAVSPDRIQVVVELGDRDDTTAGQEQYLNTNPQVVSYEVR